MYFESIYELWNMSGHGAFVWSAYAISATVLVGIIVQPLIRFRSELKRLVTMSEQKLSTQYGSPAAASSGNAAPIKAAPIDGCSANVVQASVEQVKVEHANTQGQPGVKS